MNQQLTAKTTIRNAYATLAQPLRNPDALEPNHGEQRAKTGEETPKGEQSANRGY